MGVVDDESFAVAAIGMDGLGADVVTVANRGTVSGVNLWPCGAFLYREIGIATIRVSRRQDGCPLLDALVLVTAVVTRTWFGRGDLLHVLTLGLTSASHVGHRFPPSYRREA
jgi:hypothetical protein